LYFVYIASWSIETLKRRNIKLEAYMHRKNIRIFNVKEKVKKNTEEVVSKPAYNKCANSAQKR